MIRKAESSCEKCNQKGFVVVDPKELWSYSYKTNKLFPEYCRDQIKAGINIIHEVDGCSICNPEMKWPPGPIIRWFKSVWGLLKFFRNKTARHKVDHLVQKNKKTDELPPGIIFRKTYHIKTQYSSFSNRSGSVSGKSSKEPKHTTHVSYPGANALNQDREEDSRILRHRQNGDNLGVMVAMTAAFAASSSLSSEEHSNRHHESSCNDDSTQQNNNIDSSGSDIR